MFASGALGAWPGAARIFPTTKLVQTLEETLMAYEGVERVQQDKWSRRSFMQATAAGVATGVMGTTLPRQAAASDGLRSIGLGVSEINEIQDKATKDLGFPVAGQAMGYGECLSKLLNQNDQYEIAEWYYHDLALLEPAKVVPAHRYPADQRLGQGHQPHEDRKTDPRGERWARGGSIQVDVVRREGRQSAGALALHHHDPCVA